MPGIRASDSGRRREKGESLVEKREMRNDPMAQVESLLYGADRERLLALVMEMGKRAAAAVDEAVHALQERDDALCDRVIAGDDAVDELEHRIDQECLASIALRQPVREDLRFVFAVLKSIADLERIGDQAVNIAEKAKILNRAPLVKPLVDIPRMKDLCVGMVRDALNAFHGGDVLLAEEVCHRGAELERLEEAVSGELFTLMATRFGGDVTSLRGASGLLWIAHHLTRIGDHATNMAERTYYALRGEDLKKRLKREEKERG